MDDLVTKANCPGVKSLKTTPKFRKRRKFHRRLFTSSIKLELSYFHAEDVLLRQRIDNEMWGTCKVAVLVI